MMMRMIFGWLLLLSLLLDKATARIVCTPDNHTMVCPPQACQEEEFVNCHYVECQASVLARDKSCTNSKFIHSTVECGNFACSGIQLRNHAQATCHGLNACDFMTNVTQSSLTCSGERSCGASQFGPEAVIACTGSDSCDDGHFAQTAQVSCQGYASCWRSHFQQLPNNLTCDGVESCGQSTFVQTTVECVGATSCEASTFVNAHVDCHDAWSLFSAGCTCPHINVIGSTTTCHACTVGNHARTCGDASFDSCSCCQGNDCPQRNNNSNNNSAPHHDCALPEATLALCTSSNDQGQSCSTNHSALCDGLGNLNPLLPTQAPTPFNLRGEETSGRPSEAPTWTRETMVPTTPTSHDDDEDNAPVPVVVVSSEKTLSTGALAGIVVAAVVVVALLLALLLVLVLRQNNNNSPDNHRKDDLEQRETNVKTQSNQPTISHIPHANVPKDGAVVVVKAVPVKDNPTVAKLKPRPPHSNHALPAEAYALPLDDAGVPSATTKQSQ